MDNGQTPNEHTGTEPNVTSEPANQPNHEDIANAIANNDTFMSKILNGIKVLFQEEDPIMENKNVTEPTVVTEPTQTVEPEQVTMSKDELATLLADTLKSDRENQAKIIADQKELESKLENVDDKFKEFVEFKLKNETDFDVNAFLEDKPQYKKVVSTIEKNQTITSGNASGNEYLDFAKNIIETKYGNRK